MKSDQVTVATILRNQPHDPGEPHVSGMSVQEPVTDSAPELHNNLARLA